MGYDIDEFEEEDAPKVTGFTFGNVSRQKLKGVHKDLVTVMTTAIRFSEIDFSVLEGLRSKERQQKLFNQGKSKTLNSRHITGHAVDLVPFPISWDWPKFYLVADAVIFAAKRENIAVRWGGNWRVNDIRTWEGTGEELAKAYTGSFPDGPHFELTREFYP